MSEERKKYLSKLRNRKIIILCCQILLGVAFFGLWELLTATRVLDPFFFSSPSRMWQTFVGLINKGDLLPHMLTTLYEAVLGFVIATGLGFVIAVILWWSESIRRVLEPYMVILNSLPKIALGPIIIIWFGAGTKAIVVMAILIMIIITILSMLGAFLAVDKDKILLLKSMRANKFQIFFKLVLPNSIPDIISILKINIGMTWVGTIMGEYLTSKAGLGYLIVYGGQVFKLDLVMTSTVILCVMAGIMYAIVAIIEKRLKGTKNR